MHAVLSVLVFVASLAAGIAAAQGRIEAPWKYGLGTLVSTGCLDTFNGLFEIVTGVCPIDG